MSSTPGNTPPARGTRTKQEVVREYRAAKLARGECRDCKRPAMIKRDGTPARVCHVHAAADAARKQRTR